MFFDSVVVELCEIEFCDDILVCEIVMLQGFVFFVIVFVVDVWLDGDGEFVYGIGWFVFLYDFDELGVWGGVWRIVLFVQVLLEIEIGMDFFFVDVIWFWFVDVFDFCDVVYYFVLGILMKMLLKGFGGFVVEGDGVQIELCVFWILEGLF